MYDYSITERQYFFQTNVILRREIITKIPIAKPLFVIVLLLKINSTLSTTNTVITTISFEEVSPEHVIDENFEKPNKLWSVPDARAAIIKGNNDYKNRIDGYKIDKTFKGRHIQVEYPGYPWRESSEGFGLCCEYALNDLRTVLKHIYAYAENRSNVNVSSATRVIDMKPITLNDLDDDGAKTMQRVETFINRVIEFIRDTIKYNYRTKEYKYMSLSHKWTNWYQISVMFSNVLAYYMLVPHKLRTLSRELILTELSKIVPTPYRSLSRKRSNANAVVMFGPWLITQIYSSKCNESIFQVKITGSKIYKNIVKDIASKYVTGQFAVGLHRDSTYISHKTVLGYGYLQMMCSDYTMYAYMLDKSLIHIPLQHWRRLSALTLHPRINRGPSGILNRESSFSSYIDTNANYGSEILPLSRVLRVNNRNGRFIVRGINGNLGYFEADHENNLYAQYWVQSRLPYCPNTPRDIPKFKYAYGLIFTEDHDDYIKLPSKTPTTYIYYPTQDSRSYVGAINDNAEKFLYQNYSIKQFGKYRVYELIRYSNESEHLVFSDIEIDNRSGDKNLAIRISGVEVNPHIINDQYERNLEKVIIPRGELLRIQHVINLDKCTIYTIRDKENLRDPMYVGIDEGNSIIQIAELKGINWTLDTKTNIISSSLNGPYSCAAPFETEAEKKSLRNNTFVFDPKLNYYVLNNN